MLNLTGATMIDHSEEIKVATGETVNAEGLALCQVNDNGVETVKPATGNNDKFIGFSYGQTMIPIVKSGVFALSVPEAAPFTVVLPVAPIAGQIYVSVEGSAITAGDPSTVATEYSLVGQSLTVHSDHAGKTVDVVVRYSPTAVELFYDNNVPTNSIPASATLSSIGVIKAGKVYTDQFDASQAYAIGDPVSMAAGGIVTSGAANPIPGAVVCGVPSAENPFLGIRFNTAV